MTWSIIARDEATGQLRHRGRDLRFFAVGARVPFIATGVGAVATQALVNPFYGYRRPRAAARRAAAGGRRRASLTAADDGRDQRQLHVMDRARALRRPYRRGLRRLVRPLSATAFRSPATCSPARSVLDDTAAVYRPIAAAAVRAPADRGAEGRRGGGRRQARQAIGGACSSTARRTGRISICASTTMPIRSPSSTRLEEVSRERYVHFRNSCRAARDPAGVHRPQRDRAASRSTPPTARRTRMSDVAARCRESEGAFSTAMTGAPTHAVDGVELRASRAARTLGIVGESGCGKSVTSLAIMGLLPKAIGRDRGAACASRAAIS